MIMLENDLRRHWTTLHLPLAADASLVDHQYAQLTLLYNGEQRYYHNLLHLRQLITLLEMHREHIRDEEILLWAIFFHDIIYNVLYKDNEERSARAAAGYLSQIGYPPEKIMLVSEFIYATKTHINTLNSPDLDYFLDFDLYILGSAPEVYREYAQQIRNEYGIYHDQVYNPGRKKVLRHFLEMPAIFRTPVFRELYEENARNNLRAELNTL